MATNVIVPSARRPMKNLSVSKIENALLCGLNFKYTYVEKIPEPRARVMLAGNVVHAIIEHALKEKAAHGRYPDWQTLDDMFEPTWEEQARVEEEKPWFVGWKWDPKEPEEVLKAGYRPLIRLAATQALPQITPWMLGETPVVEHRIDLELQSEVGPFQLVGYIDLLSEDGILQDWKTVREVSARKKKTWLQFAAYSLYVWPLLGEETVTCRKVFLVREPEPHIEYAPFTIGPAHREWFVRTAATVWKMIANGVYLGNTETWKCNPLYCSFYGPCRGDLATGEEGVHE